MILYHGGIGGLHPGDLLVPSSPHVFDGCPICRARAAGRIYTVGQYRRDFGPLIARLGDEAELIRETLEGVPDEAPLDPPSAEAAVYCTTVELYARWYASRSCGDLYRVKPLGRMSESREDHFETYVALRARVLQVVARDVLLTPDERREIYAMWTKADAELSG